MRHIQNPLLWTIELHRDNMTYIYIHIYIYIYVYIYIYIYLCAFDRGHVGSYPHHAAKSLDPWTSATRQTLLSGFRCRVLSSLVLRREWGNEL